VTENGTTYIDYGKFHDVEPLEKPPAERSR